MNKLANTAFHSCSNAKKKGLKEYEVLSLPEGQLDTLENIKVQNVYRKKSVRRDD